MITMLCIWLPQTFIDLQECFSTYTECVENIYPAFIVREKGIFAKFEEKFLHSFGETFPRVTRSI